MRVLTLALAAAGLAGALVMTSANPADAARKKRTEYYTGDRVYTPRGKPRSRVVVRQRSYLDPGTEVLPGERSYTEYAVPFGFSAMGTALGPTFSWDRRPFNNPWDVPHRYGW